uniref:Prokineticin domain-containing protein n=1 Tax=Arion vulgaris TaxID=1028688 RepID=A0A0B7AXD5_9EUPU
MRICLLIACLMVTLISAEVGKECSLDTECEANECCQIPQQFEVLSKRAATGTCQSYTPVGQLCNVFDKENGFCSCTPGSSCSIREVPIPGYNEFPPEKRGIASPRPGYYLDIKCTTDSS